MLREKKREKSYVGVFCIAKGKGRGESTKGNSKLRPTAPRLFSLLAALPEAGRPRCPDGLRCASARGEIPEPF